MTVNLRLFAMMRDAAGVGAMTLELPAGASAEDAVAAVAARHPSLLAFVGKLAVAVNLEYVPLSHILRDGDEVALIPPVSGGL